jgi:serine/threonine protein kinase
MHEHQVAHRCVRLGSGAHIVLIVQYRDGTGTNIMYDPTPIFPTPYHPVRADLRRDFRGPVKHLNRRKYSLKYFFVDFGIARKYSTDEPSPQEEIIGGGDSSAPEHINRNGSTTANPYKTDIYYVGNMVREDFLQVRLWVRMILLLA